MADNTTLPGTGDVISTDDIAGVKVQRVKVQHGADGSATDVSSASPLPTTALTDTQLRATAVPVSATFWQVTQPVSIASMPTTSVTGTFFQATQPVSLTSTTITGTVAVTQSGVWTVGGNSLVSTANSSAVNLAAAAVFTGTSEDVTEYSTIAVTVFASHASATDGLAMQQSANGTDWDLSDVYTIPAASGKIFSIAVSAKFYRLVYTNGATLTTSLRIQTLYSKSAKKGSSVRPSDARGNDNDFEEMSAFTHLYNGTAWDRARGTIANGMAVDVTRLSSLVAGSALIGVVRNGDGTNNVAIKAASTAAVFSDPALTVEVRPGGALVTTSAALADAVTNPTIGLQAALLSMFNGTTWDRVRGTIANGLAVDVTRHPTLTKGTQAATGVSTQDLHNAGRAFVNAATAIAGVTAVTVEALLSLNVSRDAATTAAVTTIAVTSTKRLRITGVTCGMISTGATVLSARVSLRVNPAGAVAATSPILLTIPLSSGAALAQAGNEVTIMFPEAIELSGTMQCGLTQIASAVSGTIWASLIAYEY